MPFVGIGVGVGRQRFASGGGGFDADYQAVLDYATTQGYTLPSSGQQTLQNQLVVDLKSAGIWSKLDTFAVFATDGSSDFALIDWKRLTDYTAFNSPTFTANQGFQGDGVSSYVSTNFNPLLDGVQMTNDQASMGSWIYTAATIGTEIFGTDDSLVRIRNLSNVLQRLFAGSNALTAINFSGTGLIATNKNSTTNWVYYKNTTEVYNNSFVDLGLNNKNLNLFTHTGTNSFTNAEMSIFYGGATLDLENTDLYNAFDTYINAL